MNGLRHFLLALQFFTRIPVTGRVALWVGFSPQMLRASAAHFPAVGALVGALGALVYAGAATWWPPEVAVVLSTIATVLLTGAFHEDGLADVADGLGGSPERERALEIMRDSRIGAFGAIALVLALALKIALLGVLAAQGAWAVGAALVGAHALSRLAPLVLMARLPHVGGAKSKPLADAIDAHALAVGILWSFMAVTPILWAYPAINSIVAGLLAALATLALGRLFARRLQGFTGDCLGATQQIAELAVYLGLALSA